jgi:MFS family permease
MFCKLYYIPFFLEVVKDFSPTITGLVMMTIMVAVLPSSIVAGRLMAKFGRFRWAVWSGWAITIIGTGLLILLDADLKAYGWVLIFVVVGLGQGLLLMSINVAVQAMSEIKHVADAVAMYAFTRAFGMCIGVAIGGTVFQNRLSEHLSDRRLPTAMAKNAEGFSKTLKDLPKSSTEYQAYISAYTEGFQNVFQVLTAVAGLAGLLSLFIKRYNMDKNLGSEHILQRSTKKKESSETNVVSDTV